MIPSCVSGHMRDFAERAPALVQDKTRSEVESDEVLLLALTHLVELIGAAASRVGPDTRERYGAIPWPKIVSTRNRLTHGYDYIDHDILWTTISQNLPDLLCQLDSILSQRE